jgi:hypothetical protein
MPSSLTFYYHHLSRSNSFCLLRLLRLYHDASTSLQWLCLLPCDDAVAAAAAAAAVGDLFDGSLLLQDTGAEMWEVDKPGRKMMVVWGTDVDQFDPETQVRHQRFERVTVTGNCMILVTMR